MKTHIFAAMTTLTAMLFVGCGTVREHRLVTQPLGTQLTASIGSSLFRLNKRGDLPNAFGGRDIYGGKLDKGYAEVKLKAIRNERFVELVAFDVSRDSPETTMDRYKPFDDSLARVDVSQTVNIGGTSGDPGLLVTVDTAREKEYVLSGIRVTFLEVRPSSVVYTLQDLQSGKR
jgi:hypothetical protein